ncbi:hypothetical protein [Actinomycetospora flava]|uniref:Superfamily III holin-X n=1 Tax=Actinomycetospora flava TaxID=3129232 RepID=A0ABU8M506_9PSEU
MIPAIQVGMRELGQKVEELRARIDELLARRGDSDLLRRVADQWSRSGNAIGATAGAVAADRMVTTVEWDGSAAEACRLSVPPQSAALETVQAAGTQLSTSLHAMADAIDNFWIAVGIALGAAVVGVVGAITTAMGVVTAPAAVAVAATALGVAIAAIAVGVTQGVLVVQRSETEIRAISQRMVDLGRAGRARRPRRAAPWPTRRPATAPPRSGGRDDVDTPRIPDGLVELGRPRTHPVDPHARGVVPRSVPGRRDRSDGAGPAAARPARDRLLPPGRRPRR